MVSPDENRGIFLFAIFDFRFAMWQAASVLPRVSGVLETLPRSDAQPCAEATGQSQIVNRNWNGAAAGSCTRTSSVAGRHSAVKSQPQESKRAGSVFGSHSRPAPFQQRTNTSCYLAIPTHGFTVVLSVFWGTPPAKPLKCKIRPNSSGALVGDPWADPTGGEPRLSRAFLCFVPGDII